MNKKSVIKVGKILGILILLAIALFFFISEINSIKAEGEVKDVSKSYNSTEKKITIINDSLSAKPDEKEIANFWLEQNDCNFNGRQADSDCFALIRAKGIPLDMTEKDAYNVELNTIYGSDAKDTKVEWFKKEIKQENMTYACVNGNLTLENKNKNESKSEEPEYIYPETYGECGKITNLVVDVPIGLGEAFKEKNEYLIKISAKKSPASIIDWIFSFLKLKFDEWAYFLATNMTYVAYNNVTTNTTNAKNIPVLINGTGCLVNGTDRECVWALADVLSNLTVYKQADNITIRVVNASDNKELLQDGLMLGNNTIATTAKSKAMWQSAYTDFVFLFNGSLANSTGGSATQGGTLTYNNSGLIYKAVIFDNAGDGVLLGDIMPAGVPMTFEIWLYLTAAPTNNYARLFAFPAGSEARLSQLCMTTGRQLRLLYDNSCGNGADTASATLALNTWYQLTWVDNGAINFYVNGQLTTTVASQCYANGSAFNWGMDGPGVDPTIDTGMVAMLVISNKSLTGNEILARRHAILNSVTGAFQTTAGADPLDYNISACMNITGNGTYKLNTSITDSADVVCINVSVSNVEIDCVGWNNWIDGIDAVNTVGIKAEGTSGAKLTNVSVKNCNLTDWYEGSIRYSYSQNSTLNNLSISENSYGIYIKDSDKNTLTNINASANSNRGIILE